jgi:transposase
MGRGRTKVELSQEDAEALPELLKTCQKAKDFKRLQLAKLAATGLYTREELVERTSISRSHIQRLLEKLREGGLDGLLERQKPGGSESPLQDPLVQEGMKAQLDAGKVRTAGDLQRYLQRQHGIVRQAKSLYRWLGQKLGAALRVPRPVHIKKDPLAAAAFVEDFEKLLKSLKIKPGRRVRIWFQDEGRLGLHTIVRRAWAREGHRLVLPCQRKYEWGYVHGALEIGTGRSEFAYWDGVDLEISTDFLRQIARSEPEALHIVVWDGAGFHPRADCRPIPRGVKLIVLPPYSPELNPIEKLWDVLKDGLCNQIFDTMEDLWAATTAQLEQLWEPTRIQQLIGHGGIVDPANASSLT